jgi:hypothetical protein
MSVIKFATDFGEKFLISSALHRNVGRLYELSIAKKPCGGGGGQVLIVNQVCHQNRQFIHSYHLVIVPKFAGVLCCV